MQVIRRGFNGVLAWVVALFPSLAMAETPFEQALEEMRKYRWDSALEIAEQDGQLARDIIEWHRLRAGQGTYEEVVDFLNRRPDWPGLALLRKNSEKSLIGRSAREVLDFFAEDDPRTPTGAILKAQSMIRAGDETGANQLIARIWRSEALSDTEFASISDQFETVISPLLTERLDRMLWDNRPDEVARLLPDADAGWKALAKARLALRQDQDGVDALIAAIPAALLDDPGLAYERFRWRLRKGREEDAIEMLRSLSGSAQSLGRPEYWASSRRNLARGLMLDGQGDLAYALAANHSLSQQNSTFADLEWLAGYVALKLLKDADRAIAHFKQFFDVVSSPISRARAGYWLGRAYTLAGDTTAAKAAFEQAAANTTAYYGILSAEALGRSPEYRPASVDKDAWRTADFTRSSNFQVGLISISLNESYLAERFFVQLSETLDDAEIAKLGLMLEQMSQPYLALRVAKHGVRMGELPLGPYFPLHAMADYALPVNAELVMAIARRESEFDPGAVSRAGAAGLLQLMPGTATDMAAELGLPMDKQRLVTDWKYNAALGSAYLAQLVERFGGNIVLVAAAYNAGPNRVDAWIEEFGDPRARGVDIVDWVEAIPYRETRNYVMRVAESLPVYRARLGLPDPGLSFSRELAGSTLRTFAPKGE